MKPHIKVRHGQCSTCGHYGDDCTGTMHASNLAQAVALHLAGSWTIETQSDNVDASQWGTLLGADSTNDGAEINIHADGHLGRYDISAVYPKDWEPWIEGRGHRRVYRESISVGAGKSAEHIARDITRRLFVETGYLSHLAGCLAQKRESLARSDRAFTIAEQLRVLIGAGPIAPMPTAGMRERQGAHSRGSLEYDVKAWRAHAHIVTARTLDTEPGAIAVRPWSHVEAKVGTYQELDSPGSIDVTISNLTIDACAAVVALLKQLADEHALDVR